MRLLACAMEAGGAANVAPVAALVPGNDRRVFCSDVTERYFHACGVSDAVSWSEARLVESVLAEWNPDTIVCGTTRYRSPDRLFIAAARAKGVFTAVILDEWYRYADRFRDEGNGLLYLPDAICVSDDLAFREAVSDGIPRELLVITGSPALSSLCDRLERFQVDEPPVPDVFREAVRPWIVFISETHASDFGTNPQTPGPLGPFLGYTERSVAADLAAVISEMSKPCTVVEKLHPSGHDDGRPPQVRDGQSWRRVARVAMDTLLWHADLVVGMRSMGLLEAALCGRPTISYQPGLRPPYGPSTSQRLALVASATTTHGLATWLQETWTVERRAPLPRPNFAPPIAAERIKNLLESRA